MKTLIITAVAMSLGLLSSPTFAGGSVVGSHAMPIVDPDPAGILKNPLIYQTGPKMARPRP